MGRIPDLQEQRDKDEAGFLRFVEELALEQKAGGRLLLGENPWSSDAKETRPLRRLQDKHGFGATSASTSSGTSAARATI